jgi:hypothetical protein
MKMETNALWRELDENVEDSFDPRKSADRKILRFISKMKGERKLRGQASRTDLEEILR